jgi:hypothetical protein
LLLLPADLDAIEEGALLGSKVFDRDGGPRAEVALEASVSATINKMPEGNSRLSWKTYAASIGDIVDLDGDVLSRDGLVRNGELTG